MAVKNFKPEVGKRILFQTSSSGYIHDGVIEEVSPSGKMFQIRSMWYSIEESSLGGGPVQAEIFEEFSGTWKYETTPAEEKKKEGKEDD